MREQTQYLDNLIWANDFEYENKQKNLDSVMVYEGLHFSLDAQNSGWTFLITIILQLIYFINTMQLLVFLKYIFSHLRAVPAFGKGVV